MQNGTATKKEIDKPDIDYALIRQWLKNGEIAAIAKRHKIPPDSAYKILAGKFKNFAFVQACYEKAIERATTFHALQEKLRANSVKK